MTDRALRAERGNIAWMRDGAGAGGADGGRGGGGEGACRIDCTITVGEHGPDCPDIRDPDSIAIGTMFRCKPWDGGWPTDPAPRWGAEGPPHWSR